MRRTVATLLVVATALLMAVPVGASEALPVPPAALPAAPAMGQAPAVPAAPVVGEAPAVPAAAAVMQAPAAAAPPPAVKARRATALNQAGISEAGYAARLQVDLCVARQIFCGLDHSGRYPAR